MKPDKTDRNSEKLNMDTVTSATTKTALLDDPEILRPLTFNEIIKTLTVIKRISKEDALTEFSNMNTIYGMDTASDMVFNMQKDYLIQHKFHPYLDSDGRYRGYVYWEDKEGKNHRKPIAAQDIVSLTCKAMEFYQAMDPFFNSKPMTFKRMFPEFMKTRHDEGVCDSTLSHDEYDWKRFLESDPIAQKSIKNITYVEFVSWFKKKLLGGLMDQKTGEVKPFTSKQAKTMRSLLTVLFQYAVDHGYASENLSSKMGKFRYQKFCRDEYKPDWDQVYQDDEPTKIMDLAFFKFRETKNFAYMAVILNFLLDLRVGELVTLKYSDLLDKPGQIHIQRQETIKRELNRSTGMLERKGYQEVNHTKTWHDRFIVLSDAAINVIKIIKDAQTELGIESEYLFINSRGDRMHSNSVDRVLRTVLNPGIGTSHKSCHNIRKTVTSELRIDLGVGVAARVAGHKNESTTDQHYSFLTTSTERYADEYIKVIDKKVPDYLKSANFS